MRVKELKKILSKMKADDLICFNMCAGCCGDLEGLECLDVVIGKGFVEFRFESLPGYRSCLQAGNTIRADEEYWKNKK